MPTTIRINGQDPSLFSSGLMLHHRSSEYSSSSSPIGSRIERRTRKWLQPLASSFFPLAGTMDVPESDPGPANGSGSSFLCDLCNKETVENMSKVLLPGLATACLDNTNGIFKGPASVAGITRNELVLYLSRRSQTYPAEADVQGKDEVDKVEKSSKDPTEIISVFLDDFASSKRNLISRVSGWLSSDKREEKINDFVQEMQKNSFWPMPMRDAIAAIVLRNVDLKSTFHCSMMYNSTEQLAQHKKQCVFRILNCTNDGCKATFSAIDAPKHDSGCPFKLIPCEQKCPENIVRYEMNRHCSTVCPMKLISCPFHQIGCTDCFPQCNLEKHCSEYLHSHLLCFFQVSCKQESSVEELKRRVQLLEKSQSLCELSEALDVRSLTLTITEQEKKMNKLECELRDMDIKSLKQVIREQEEKMKKLEHELGRVRDEKASKENEMSQAKREGQMSIQ